MGELVTDQFLVMAFMELWGYFRAARHSTAKDGLYLHDDLQPMNVRRIS